MAAVPDYSVMSDAGEFNAEPGAEEPVTADIGLAQAESRRSTGRQSSTGLGWLIYLIPVIASTFLGVIAVSRWRKGKAPADEEEPSIDPHTDEEELVLEPEGIELDEDESLLTAGPHDVTAIDRPVEELDLEQMKSETAALLDDSGDDLNVIDVHTGEGGTDSFVFNDEAPSSVAMSNVDGDPISGKVKEKLERTISKYQFAKKRNEQLKSKLIEKLATIEILEKELVRLREALNLTSEKNDKLKSKLREKLDVIEDLKNSSSSENAKINDSGQIPPLNLSTEELSQSEDTFSG